MDTFQGRQTDPLSLHRYLYCADSPIMFTDPSGQDLTETVAVASIGAGLGAISTATANYALGRAQTMSSILTGAAFGAVLGPFAVAVPEVGVGLGVLGVAVSGTTAYQVFSNPASSPSQRAAALALVVASVYGTQAAIKYSGNPRVPLPEVTPEDPIPPTRSPVLSNPITAPAGTIQRGVNPAALRAGAQMRLQASRLAVQKGLIQSGTKRYDPIVVTRQGVIYDGTHGARAAVDLGALVDVVVVDLNIEAGPPVADLPVW